MPVRIVQLDVHHSYLARRVVSLSCLFLYIHSHSPLSFFFFFLNDPPTPDIYPLSLHDALPISMSVRRAEVFGFLGPNGAGKTTAVKLLVGRARPTAGEGWVLGAPLGDLQTRRRLGYLPELFR